MLADRSMLSSERLHPAADSDRYRNPLPNSGWSLGTHGRIGERIVGTEEDKNATERPTEPLNTWSLNNEPKNIHSLDLGLSAHM